MGTTKGQKYMNPRLRALSILEYLKKNTDKEHPITKPSDIKKSDIDFYNKYVKSKVTFGKCIYDLADFYSSDENGYRFNTDCWKIYYDSFYEREKINAPNYEFNTDEDCDDVELDNQIRNLYYNHCLNYDELDQIIMGIHMLGLDSESTKNLINKLTNCIASKYYKSLPNAVFNMHYSDNIDKHKLSNNLKLINEAIGNGENLSKKISFVFCGYNLEKILTETKSSKYIVNPLEIAIYLGKYYLFAKTEGYDNISIWRIDLMNDLEICREFSAKSNDFEKLNKKTYYEHLNMFYDKPINVILKIYPSKYEMSRKTPDFTFLYDYFGDTYTVLSVNDSYAKIKVKASENAIINWALQYSDRVEILEPIKTRSMIIKKITDLKRKYEV